MFARVRAGSPAPSTISSSRRAPVVAPASQRSGGGRRRALEPPPASGTVDAGTHYLHGVVHVNETMPRGLPLRPTLDRRTFHLHGPAAEPAHQMVMMTGSPAAPVELLS